MTLFDDLFKKSLNAENLSCDESSAAMLAVMNGEVSPVKLSAWLAALKVKGETPEEIAGAAAAMRKQATTIPCDDPNAVDTCGTGGDGSGTINVSTTAALVAAGAGVTVAKHGNKAVSSRSGSADVLSALGVNIAISPEKMSECLNKVGIAFLFAPALHPAMKHAMPVRKELRVRTIFNILGPLSNPAGVSRAVLGVYDAGLCQTIAEAAKDMGLKRILVVHGNDGLDEISVTAPTQVCELRDGEVKRYELTPEQFGFERASLESLRGGEADENATVVKSILTGEIQGPQRNIILLNAAAAILAAEKATDWDEALKMAGQSIDDGAAAAKLEELIAFTQTS